MGILEYSEATERKCIIVDGQPYEVISSHVFRKQMRKPVNATKLRNLITGKITEVSFHQSEKIKEADIETKEAKFLYKSRGEFWFCEPNDPSKRFKLEETLIGDQARFMKANSMIELVIFEEKIIGTKLPVKVELKVTEAPPAVKGDTATGGTKQITLETGAIINAPLFVNEGDVVSVNTLTGEYTSRV